MIIANILQLLLLVIAIKCSALLLLDIAIISQFIIGIVIAIIFFISKYWDCNAEYTVRFAQRPLINEDGKDHRIYQ